jgi:predicted PurR-regulated permease PerM
MRESLPRQRMVLFGMIAVLGVLALLLVWPFVIPILTALALVVILKPVYGWFLKKRWVRGKEGRAAGATVTVFILAIVIPVGLVVASAISQAQALYEQIVSEGIDLSISGIADALGQAGYTGGVEGATTILSGVLGDVLVRIGKSIPALLTGAIVIMVLLFVLLPRYRRPGRDDVLDLIPFPPEITNLFLDKADLMIGAMFKGTFVIAIVSGAAMGVVLWIAGVPYVMLLTILSMFLALVPMVGISLVAWPVGILLIVGGQTWQGVFVIVAFVLVVANIDNVLRPLLVPRGARLNIALVVLSVLGGLALMGFIGIIYGPVVMILLVTSLEVYTKYMLRSDLEALQAQGRIDLEALGLESKADREEPNVATMAVTALRNVSRRLRGEAAKVSSGNAGPKSTAPSDSG